MNDKKEMALLIDMGKITAMADLLLVIAARHDEDSDAYKSVVKQYDQIYEFLREYTDICKKEMKL
jgi:hypothetical protein